MKGVILAAGCGTRMSGVIPKALLEIGWGFTLIDRNVALVRNVVGGDPVIVIGYKAMRFMRRLGATAAFIYNEDYQDSGSLYSLWLAYQTLRESLLVAFADIYVDWRVPAITCLAPDRVTVASGYDGRGVRLYLNDLGQVEKASAATEPDAKGVRFSGYARLSRRTLEGLPLVPNFRTASLGFGLIGCEAIEVAGASINVNTPDDLECARRVHGKGRL